MTRRDLILGWMRRRWMLFFAGLTVLGISTILSWQVPVDPSLSRMLPKNHPERKRWDEFQRIFGPQELVLLAYRDPELFSPTGAGMRRLEQLARKIRAIPGVIDVWSLDQLMGELITLQTPITRRLRTLFENYTHNQDGNLACLIVLLERFQPTAGGKLPVIAELESLSASLPEGVLAGPPALAEWGVRMVERDSRRVAITAGILLALVIFACSGHVKWVVLSGLIVVMAVTGARATLVVLGRPGSLIDSTLFAVVTVVGVAALMHVAVRWRRVRSKRASDEDTFLATTAPLFKPVVLALLTDAVGFGALMVSQVAPVRDFALLAVVAMTWILVGLFFFLPAVVLWDIPWPGNRHGVEQTRWGAISRGCGRTSRQTNESHLKRWLFRLLKQAIHRPGAILLIAAVLLSVGLAGWLQVDYETDFTKNFRQGSEIVLSYSRLENELGGAGIWDIALPAPPALTAEYLAAVQNLETRLREETHLETDARASQGLTKVLSLADVSAVLDYEVPGTPRLTEWARNWGLQFLKARMPGLYQALYRSDPDAPQRFWFRILLRSREQYVNHARRAIIEKVAKIVDEEWPSIEATLKTPQQSAATHELNRVNQQTEAGRDSRKLTDRPARPLVAGYYVILSTLVESLLADQRVSMLLALCGLFLVFLIGFRSQFLALAAVLVNLLPILLVLGAIGAGGLRLNLGSAMMAAVALGLSVDGTIHYLAAFQQALRTGAGPLRAICRAQATVGLASLYATLALVLGFMSLIQSQFIPTAHFGILLSCTMLGGLGTNLTVLPSLLSWRLISRRGETDRTK